MANIKIVTDSSITIEPEVVEEYGISIVPLSVMVDGVLYSDSELGQGDFLRLMQSSKNLPKTSQPPVGVFAEIYENLAADGAHIVSIHMSHALSGTVEAARQGATLSGADVTVIDSGFTDQAMKENLVKGGRIGRVTGLLSSLLNIRVVMEMKDHQLEPIVKGRGNKTFKKWLDELTEKLSRSKVAEIGISYAGTAEWANEMKAQLQSLVETAIPVLETGSIIQTHTGENAFAVLVRYE